MNWLNTQWEWLKSFLSEMADGVQKGSSKRIAQIALTFTFVGNYTRIALGKEALPDVPDSWIFLLGIVLGITSLADYFNRKNGKTEKTS